MLVSVVIPNYNLAPYLRLAVESALAQSYHPLEVVVVDDGSTDDSPATIADLVDAGRVRLVRRENGGVAAARNTGVAHSAGDYLLFLDSDDTIAPTLVERLAALVDATDPYIIAYCSFMKIDVAGAPLTSNNAGWPVRRAQEANLLPQLLVRNYIQLNGVLLSRRLLHAIGGFDPRHLCEDYDLLLRLFCAGARARFLDEPLACYRQRPGSLSTDRAAMEASAAAVRREVVERYPREVNAAVLALVEEVEWIGCRAEEWYVATERSVEEYVRSLREVLAARERELEEAKAYIAALEASRREAETYARALEAELRVARVGSGQGDDADA
jgi:GT2 family glycosyltransferase